jgi:hypothetical protein
MTYIGPQTGTVATIAGTTSSVTLFPDGAQVNGRIVYNGSTAPLYLTFGTVSGLTLFTNQVGPSTSYSFPIPCYAGQVTAIWPVVNGSANTTQW